MAFKTYVLLDTMDVSVPIYQRVNDDQRVQIKKRAWYAPFLQLTVFNDEGALNLRYKESCDTVLMDEQIEKKKIPANAKFTNSERKDRLFRNGMLTTNKPNLQRFLEIYPGFTDSNYTSESVPHKEYSLFDKGKSTKMLNAEVRKRANAVNKVLDLELAGAQEMLIRLNGSFFKTPTDLEECQNMLIDFIDEAEDGGLNAVLADDINVDEKTTVLIGKLINQGTLSFDAVDGKISKLDKDGKWVVIREMSSTYSLTERKRMFSDFLNTNDGKALKDDLRNDIKEEKDEVIKEDDEEKEVKRMGRPKKNL